MLEKIYLKIKKYTFKQLMDQRRKFKSENTVKILYIKTQDIGKAVLRGKFIALKAHVVKEERLNNNEVNIQSE